MRTSTPNPISSPLSKTGTGKTHGQMDNKRPDVECKGGESYASGNEKTADSEDRDAPGGNPGDDAGNGGLDEPIDPAEAC